MPPTTTFEIAPLALSDGEKLRILARQLRGPDHLAEVLAAIPDPILRAEVRMLFISLVPFPVPDETEEPDPA